MGGKGSGPRPRKNRVLPQCTAKPKCPTWLDRKGKSEWRRIVNILDRVPDLCKEPDWDVVALLASAWSEWHAACATIKSYGYYIEPHPGNVRVHPAVKVKQEAAAQIVAISKQLAMTPQARRLLNGTKPPEEKKANPLDEYLARRGGTLTKN